MVVSFQKANYDVQEIDWCSKPDCEYCQWKERTRLNNSTEKGMLILGLVQKEKSATVADFFLRSF